MFRSFIVPATAALIVLIGCVAPTSELEDEGDADIGTTQLGLNDDTGSIAAEATVYENATGNNGGNYTSVCVGNVGTTSGATTMRRGFVRYNLPSIPSGSTITRVTVTFNRLLVRATGGPVSATLSFRRVTESWSEGNGGTQGTLLPPGMSPGTQACGSGTNVTGIDWANQPNTQWFNSASHSLGSGLGNITIDSDGPGDSGLVNDVQAWHNNAATNFGWRLTVADSDNNARLLTPGTFRVYWTERNGRSCSFDSDCTSGNCVRPSGADCGGTSGCVCCSASTCTGSCRTCFRSGSVGTCGAESGSVSCRSASCNGGTDVETLAATCTGSSTSCPPAVTNNCNPYQCGSTSCRTSCTSDTHCLATSFCNMSNMCEVVSDECAQGLDDCVNPPIGTCNDPTVAIGNWVCGCIGGYSGDGTTGGTGCNDINECTAGTDNCHANATCSNTVGNFICTCNSGFSGSGVVCTDLNECILDTDNCDTNAMCANTIGSFTCTCNTGYRGSGVTGMCAEIDECTEGTDNCHADAMCTNTPGSWDCDCNSGFLGDGITCTDIDECMDPMITGGCSTASTCNNLPGSWECVCNSGYRGDGFVCDDIDECTEGTDTCHAEATCTNTVGSYSCTCNSGYRGSGFDCADIDECAEGTHGCGTNESCVNQIGIANTCVCRPGFIRPDPMAECETSCGDGFTAPGEACDDGNLDNDDGCSSLCEVEDGWVCFEPTGTVSTCNMTCGDGFIDIGEECDDGTGNDNSLADACRTTCERANCGDGTVDTGEECDDGPGNDDATIDACRTTCNLPYCGDGVIDDGELCDVGGGVPGAAVAGQCTTLCMIDAGLDAMDPPVLTGGACACRATTPSSSTPWGIGLGLIGALLFVRRRRR